MKSREIQTLQQENLTLEKQIHALNMGGPGIPNQPGAPVGPNNKLRSFDNPSASSTASSGVGTSISSLNATNSSLNSTANGAIPGQQQQQQAANAGAQQKSNVVKQYMETKLAMQQQNLQQQQQMNNMNQQQSGSPSTGLFNSLLGGSDKNPAKIGAGLLSTLTGAVNSNQNNSNNPNGADPNNPNPNPNDNPLSAGLSLFGSKFTSGFDSLKSQATGSLTANKLTSKLMNPFSSS